MKYWIHDLYFYGLASGLSVKHMFIKYDMDKEPYVILIPSGFSIYYKTQEFIDGLKFGKLTQ